MLKAIVGFRLPITRLDGKRKLSQNRDAADPKAAAVHQAAPARIVQQPLNATCGRSPAKNNGRSLRRTGNKQGQQRVRKGASGHGDLHECIYDKHRN